MSSDFLLTPEELRLRRQKRRRLLIAGLSVIVGLALLLAFGRPARHAVKSWQGRRHAEKARGLIDAEKWNEAQKEATAAYQLSPREPEAIRAVARFLSRVRQPQALEFWALLAQQQPLTREDLRDEASVALALGETGRASGAVGSLLAHEGRDATPGDWILAAQLAGQRNRPAEALAALERVATDPKASTREQFQATVLELGLAATKAEPGQPRQAQAWKRLEKLAAGKDAAGLDALVLLAQRELSGGTTAVSSESPQSGNPAPNTDGSAPIPPLTNNQPQITASALSEALAHHPLAKTPQQLLALDLQIHADSDRKAALIQSATDRHRNTETESLIALGTWLNGKGEFERELETIPQSRAVQQKDLFLQRLDAFGGLGRWDKIKEALQSETHPLDAVTGKMYLARCSAQLGENIAAENNWQRALEAAVGDVPKLMALADYAQKNGATAIAGRAYDAAIAAAPSLRSAWQGKLNVVQSTRETKAIHQVLAAMLQIWPKDSALQNDEAYLRLLLAGGDEVKSRKSEVERSDGEKPAVPSASPITDNRELITVAQIAEQLVRLEPSSLPHRTLLALVYLKQNRPATALGVYQDLHVPANALTPSALAVHAAVLAANGNLADAEKEASQVPRNSLLPEERALIESLTTLEKADN